MDARSRRRWATAVAAAVAAAVATAAAADRVGAVAPRPPQSALRSPLVRAAAGGGTPPPPWSRDASVHLGMSLAPFCDTTLTHAQLARSILSMRAAGVRHVSINVFGMQATANATAITVGASADCVVTPPLVRWLVRRVHAAGMEAFLKPHVNVASGAWRGEIRPSAAWWAAYRGFIWAWATVAAEEGVATFSIGVEQKRTLGDVAEWLRVLGGVRARYKRGRVTYCANWDSYMAVSPRLWKQLDFIGINAYFPLGTTTARGADGRPPPPRLTQLRAAWAAHAAAIDGWRSRAGLPAVPVVFTEAGYKSIAGAPWRPYEWRNTGGQPVDLSVQRDAYDALLSVMARRSWFKGVYWWTWEARAAAADGDRGYSPQHKPAEGVVRYYYQTALRVPLHIRLASFEAGAAGWHALPLPAPARRTGAAAQRAAAARQRVTAATADARRLAAAATAASARAAAAEAARKRAAAKAAAAWAASAAKAAAARRAADASKAAAARRVGHPAAAAAAAAARAAARWAAVQAAAAQRAAAAAAAAQRATARGAAAKWGAANAAAARRAAALRWAGALKKTGLAAPVARAVRAAPTTAAAGLAAAGLPVAARMRPWTPPPPSPRWQPPPPRPTDVRAEGGGGDAAGGTSVGATHGRRALRLARTGDGRRWDAAVRLGGVAGAAVAAAARRPREGPTAALPLLEMDVTFAARPAGVWSADRARRGSGGGGSGGGGSGGTPPSPAPWARLSVSFASTGGGAPRWSIPVAAIAAARDGGRPVTRHVAVPLRAWRSLAGAPRGIVLSVGLDGRWGGAAAPLTVYIDNVCVTRMSRIPAPWE